MWEPYYSSARSSTLRHHYIADLKYHTFGTLQSCLCETGKDHLHSTYPHPHNTSSGPPTSQTARHIALATPLSLVDHSHHSYFKGSQVRHTTRTLGRKYMKGSSRSRQGSVLHCQGSPFPYIAHGRTCKPLTHPRSPGGIGCGDTLLATFEDEEG